MFSTLKVYVLYLGTTNVCLPLFSTDIKSFTRSPAVGENFTYWCKYNQALSNCTKFICKGEDPSICTPLVSTRDPNRNKRFWMNDNKKKKNITMTVREVTVDDSGTYWFGAESTNEHRSNRFFNRLSLTVGEPCYFIIWPWVIMHSILKQAHFAHIFYF